MKKHFTHWVKKKSEIMITQGTLPFQLEIEKSDSGMTSFSGLPLYIELAIKSGLCSQIEKTLTKNTRGWSDLQIIMSIIMINLAGGDCVDDVDKLEADAGMRQLMLQISTHNMKPKARRAHEKRWRKSSERSFPSASSIRRYLNQFHNESEEKERVEGKAFIPSSNELLKSLTGLNLTLVEFFQENQPSNVATLDQDATLCETNKKDAFYCYKKFKAYQPFNTYWHEKGLLLHSEFRDGNVNAGFEQLRILKESLNLLPENIDKVYLRSDSAGYQQDLLKYCSEGRNQRFGVIEFAISAKVTGAFKQATLEVKDNAWHKIHKIDKNGISIETNQEFAEVCFVPEFVAAGNKKAKYRYIAIREKMVSQKEINGLEPIQLKLPFPTLDMETVKYKLFGIVTNTSMAGNELINWHRERCGDSEKVHSIEKNDFAGGQFPSKLFGANAAWWVIMMLSFNLNVLMTKLACPEKFKSKRMKNIRFYIIAVAGRFVKHARTLALKLSGGENTYNLFISIRENISGLINAP